MSPKSASRSHSLTIMTKRLTFELSGRQRQDARPGLAKMYRVPPDLAWWPAVGAPLERGVRPQRGKRWHCYSRAVFLAAARVGLKLLMLIVEVKLFHLSHFPPWFMKYLLLSK